MKKQAALEGRSIREIIIEGLEKVVPAEAPAHRQVSFPLIRSKNPVKRRINGDMIYGGVEFP